MWGSKAKRFFSPPDPDNNSVHHIPVAWFCRGLGDLRDVIRYLIWPQPLFLSSSFSLLSRCPRFYEYRNSCSRL
jgi:hypothetical protein